MEENINSLSIESLYDQFGSSSAGLSSNEASLRLEKYGYNEPARKHNLNILVKLVLEFASPLIFVLIVIAIFSYFIGEKTGAFLIVAMAVAGAIISFLQEVRAEKDSKKLIEMVRVKATVVRNEKPKEIDLREIVPGDIVKLSAGTMVPGDIRIIESKGLFINQSVLTGESFPAEKSTNPDSNTAFMGSSVISGSGIGLVIKTGLATQFGKLSSELAQKETKTDFDRGISRFVYLMLRIILVLVLVIFIINFITKGNFLQAFLFSLAVAVGLVPEMLPLMVAVNLSKGAIKMSKKKVIVKKLNSIQNFGAMNVLCTDKTGTLTQDCITLVKHCNSEGEEDEDVLRYAYMNSFYQTGLDNILDSAILEHTKLSLENVKKIDEIPFDFSRKSMSVVIQESGVNKIICKGAPEVIFQKCRKTDYKGSVNELNAGLIAKLNQIYDKMSGDGFRVLALAYRQIGNQKDYSQEDEQNLIFKGFVAFLDPPRPEVAQTIYDLEKLGIGLKVITGDNEQVTRRICEEVKFQINGLTNGDQIKQIGDSELAEVVKKSNVFVRIDPLQKERIIKAFQSNQNVVGFLGDGINDAPAIKAADVGISVNNAVDIAKETADIILLEKSLMILEDCVQEGRKTFGNTIKYIKMGASSNFGNMFSMTGASVFLPFLPLTPIQIILNNFLYDFCQITIPYDKVDASYLKKPRSWDMKFIGRFMFFFGLTSSIFDFLTFGILWFIFHASPELFRTGWFLESLGTQTLVIHVIRTSKIPFLESRPSNLLFLSSILVVLIGFLITYLPMGNNLGFVKPTGSLIAVLVSIILFYLVIVQIVKNWFIKKFGYE